MRFLGVVYKRRKFASKREWVDRGLGPFIGKCAAVVATRRYIERDDAWRAFLRERPRADAPERTLKALEDRWDAVLCALAVALEHLERDAMHAYTGCEPDACDGAHAPPGAHHGADRGGDARAADRADHGCRGVRATVRGGFLAGGYETEPTQFEMERLPSSFSIADTPLDLSVLRRLMEGVREQLPVLSTAPLRLYRAAFRR